MVRPVFSRIFWVAGIGPVNMVTGSTPARAKLWNLARILKPSSLAFSSLMIRTADAPSVICELLPAVCMPSGSTGFSRASSSSSDTGVMPT